MSRLILFCVLFAPVIPVSRTYVWRSSCTRQVKDQRASMIDQSWTNNMNKHVKTNNIDTDSDHDLILTTLLVKGSVRNVEIVKRRDYSKFNKDNYLLDLMGLK